MKKYLIIFIILSISGLTLSAQNQTTNIKLEGDVGGYKIEMIINSVNTDSSTFEGIYKYLSQKNYLDIKGENYGECIYIEEFYNENITGSFYLNREGDYFSGYWANEKKSFDVNLSVVEGNTDLLKKMSEEDYQALVTESINGRYEVNHCYINEYFATDESPFYQIGYNGGFVNIKEIGTDSIEFDLEFICGPTSHFAFAEGVAVKKGDVYLYKEDPYETGEFCEISFKFGNKSLYVSANNSMSCGFGARAYVDHHLLKVSD
jgi:hypothetical protein